MKLIEKKVPSETKYIVELDRNELETIWNAVSSSAFQCEQTYNQSTQAKNVNMAYRIDYERLLSKQLFSILHDEKT